MSRITDMLLARNETYAAAHEPRPPLPSLNTIVVSCTDARVDPAHVLGLAPGEAVVLRNAGGRVSEAIEREVGLLIAMASTALGRPAQPDIVLIHHTDCGVERLADPKAVARLSRASGISDGTLEGLVIQDPVESLNEDVERLQKSPYIMRGAQVSAIVYDQHSGRASLVTTSTLT